MQRVPTPIDCPIPNAITALPYRDDSVKKAILSLKRRKHPELTRSFADRMYESSREMLAELVLTHNFSDPLIVPVPASEHKLRSVGFNHAAELAQAYAHYMMYDFDTQTSNTIMQKKHLATKQAHTQSKAERYRNIRDAYSINAETDIHNRCIVLIDDVITTGATMSVLRQLLLDAGARHVICIALAH